MNVSGNSTSCAPCPEASAASIATRSMVASRSRMTGSAWTHATVTASFTPGSLQRRRPGAHPAEPRGDHGIRRVVAGGVAGDGRDELVPVEREQGRVLPGADGGRARHVSYQRDLAEVLARPHRCHLDA